MLTVDCDVTVIGAGPGGLSAAIAAKTQGAPRVVIIERDHTPGGILQQCIHPGFGLDYFAMDLTGPEYAGRFVDQAIDAGIEFFYDSMVVEILPGGIVVCINAQYGIMRVHAKSIVLAMGCRERTRGNIRIPGTRPAGIYTAGAAQRLCNRQNELVGREIVILGSGDIGMIMARRMTLEGAKVIAVIEQLDYLTGLTRNRVQCLDDYGIPLYLSHTVTEILGSRRVEGVKIARVDINRRPIPETERLIACDTLLLSVGLIPENELSRAANIEISSVTNGPVINQYMQTSAKEVFACGNVVHVNDLVDNVTLESELAGTAAARHAMGLLPEATATIDVVPGKNIRSICPQHVVLTNENENLTLFFRVASPARNVRIAVTSGGHELAAKRSAQVNPGEMEHINLVVSDLMKDGLVVSSEAEEIPDAGEG